MNIMKNHTGGIIAIIASILVLFSATVDPRITIIISILALVGIIYFDFTKK